jgi:beta-lactam-binding protein with PASTA domain/tRNA A-37 threonylcarbamoyl transferase component Bud32
MTERTLSARYRVENRLGAGGMATVFAGMDMVLRRRVAIKMLRPQFAEDEDFVKRFYSEAQHAAKLSHPNVVNVYDVGHEGESYFIIMELVDGSTLAEMIAQDGRLPEAVAIDFATQICAGMAYAHRQGLLHRDIKPANILVTKDDVVKLSDFGIARAVTTQTVTITQPGMVMGSVFYLSPEQAQGHELAATSDLYSLGIVLYQMLSGVLPYTGESPITVALKHVSNPVPALDAGDSEISPALAAIVKKLMQKDPAARFQSATEVAKALREAREHPLVTHPFDVSGGGRTAADTTLEMPLPKPKPRPARFPDRPLDGQRRAATAVFDERENDRSARPGRRGVYALLALALVVAIGIGYAAFKPLRFFGPPTPVALDNLAGRTADDAEKVLSDEGLAYKITTVPSETVPKDRVVRQDPAASRSLSPRTVVELFVSSGLPMVQLLDLRQYSLEDAQRYLRDAKLVPKVSPRFDAKVAKGIVLGQNPPANSQLPIRSSVSLIVSQGPRPVAVPDLVTRTLNDATEELARRGLRLEIGERVTNDNIAPDVVASQNPPPGAQVDPGATITVVVSAGPETLGLPDVRGRNAGEASATLQSSGFVTRIDFVVDQSVASGTVLDQNPIPAAQVRKGSLVALSVGVPGVVPDVSGLTLGQATAALMDAGYKLAPVQYGSDGEPGKIVRSEPEASAQLRPGETVLLHVAGPPP